MMMAKLIFLQSHDPSEIMKYTDLLLKKHFFSLLMFCCLIFSCKPCLIFFRITVTFNQFNASLLKHKYFSLLKKQTKQNKRTDPKLFNSSGHYKH